MDLPLAQSVDWRSITGGVELSPVPAVYLVEEDQLFLGTFSSKRKTKNSLVTGTLPGFTFKMFESLTTNEDGVPCGSNSRETNSTHSRQITSHGQSGRPSLHGCLGPRYVLHQFWDLRCPLSAEPSLCLGRHAD